MRLRSAYDSYNYFSNYILIVFTYDSIGYTLSILAFLKSEVLYTLGMVK